MAVEKWNQADWETYYCGSNKYGERHYRWADVISFTRRDASTANVTVEAYVQYWNRYIRWVNPNGWSRIWAVFNGVERGYGELQPHPDDCSGSWVNGVNTRQQYTFTQTSSNITNIQIDTRCGYQTTAGGHYFTASGDGFGYLDLPIPTNYQILPPTGLTGSITSQNPAKVTATASLGSWSTNPNIKGTPYESTWNFQARIMNGTTVVATVTRNTGEAKNATFEFTGIALKSGINYHIEITAKNDYQQTQVINTGTFSFPCLGHIISPDGTDDKILYFTVTDSIEEGENTKYSYQYITES